MKLLRFILERLGYLEVVEWPPDCPVHGEELHGDCDGCFPP